MTYCKQDKVLLVVLADTVVDPRTVVVHLANAPFTDTEMTIIHTQQEKITIHSLKQALHSNKPAGTGEYQTPAPTSGHQEKFTGFVLEDVWKAE